LHIAIPPFTIVSLRVSLTRSRVCVSGQKEKDSILSNNAIFAFYPGYVLRKNLPSYTCFTLRAIIRAVSETFTKYLHLPLGTQEKISPYISGQKKGVSQGCF